MRNWRQFLHNLMQCVICLDSLVGNVLHTICSPFSNNVWADETISSRCGRLSHRNPYKTMGAVIDWIWQHILRLGPDHCFLAYQKEMARYHFPPSMRNQPPPSPQ